MKNTYNPVQNPFEKTRLSKTECQVFVQNSLENPELIDAFIKLLPEVTHLGKTNILRILKYISTKNHILISKYNENLFEFLKKNQTSEGLVRQCLTLFSSIEIHPKIEGELYDFCFQKIIINQTSIAVKAFSMTVCFKIAQKQKELLKELKLVISDIRSRGSLNSSGINARAKNVLKMINQC